MQDSLTFSAPNCGNFYKIWMFFAKFPNKSAPSSQTELRQMTEQNTANSVIKNASNLKYLKVS